jgi:hypothetical protein
MPQCPHRRDLYLSYLALMFVSGEFLLALRDVVFHGHLLALYLALSALIRETHGGAHYHDIVVYLIRRLYSHQPLSLTAPSGVPQSSTARFQSPSESPELSA